MALVNFYGVNATINFTQDLSKVLVKLLEKVLESGNRSMIFSNSLSFLQELDSIMWTSVSWLPHGLIIDKFNEMQPILLTNELRNCNNATSLFIVDNSEFEVLNRLERVFIIFNLNNMESLAFFEKRWNALKSLGFNLKYFKQNEKGKFQNEIP